MGGESSWDTNRESNRNLDTKISAGAACVCFLPGPLQVRLLSTFTHILAASDRQKCREADGEVLELPSDMGEVVRAAEASTQRHPRGRATGLSAL